MGRLLLEGLDALHMKIENIIQSSCMSCVYECIMFRMLSETGKIDPLTLT